MTKINPSPDEVETIINFSSTQIGSWAEVYTNDRYVMKRYEKFRKEHPEYATLIKEDDYSMTYSVHPKCASLYPRAPKKMNLTQEQIEQRKLQLAKYMSQKQA